MARNSTCEQVWWPQSLLDMDLSWSAANSMCVGDREFEQFTHLPAAEDEALEAGLLRRMGRTICGALVHDHALEPHALHALQVQWTCENGILMNLPPAVLSGKRRVPGGCISV